MGTFKLELIKEVFIMIYRDDEHSNRFHEQFNKLNGHLQEDSYYLSALYIITSTEKLFQKVSPYFHIEEGFQAEEMFANEEFSHVELVLAKLAGHLFKNNYHVTPLDLIELDEKNYQIAMSAMYIRKYGVS